MPKLAGHRNVAVATMFALPLLFLATCVSLLSACSSPQHAPPPPGTAPAIWTGPPAPPTTAGAAAEAPAPQSATTQLKAPDGTAVATAKFDFSNGYATITIATTR